MQKPSGQWCIIDFGESHDIGDGDPEQALCKDVLLFADQLVKDLHTDHKCSKDTLSFIYTYYGAQWCHEHYTNIRKRFNRICPWLDDLLLLHLAKMRLTRSIVGWPEDVVQLPQEAELVQHMTKKAMSASSQS